MAESDATRQDRHELARAVEAYRTRLFDEPENEKEVAREVADQFGVSQKELRERAEAGA